MSKKIWGGRFKKGNNEKVEIFTSSLEVDKDLYAYDIKGSIAHVEMLSKNKIISSKDKTKIIKALNQVKRQIDKNNFNFKVELEDVHMNIEDAITKKIGNVGKKVHTARSRNDQVVTDVKLFTKDNLSLLKKNIISLEKKILKKSEINIDLIFPFYTHLQSAQPILLSHYLLAFFEMFKRDLDRINNALYRIDENPLGSCAGAGTSFKIDRLYTTKKLGFRAPTRNSLDSVSDRDFIVDAIYCCAMTMMHLSRFSEDLVIWHSSEFGFIDIDDQYTTGSSIMPQKKNPDILELIRGRTGLTYGNLMNLLTNLKGLPLTYNRDLQEDKSPLFVSLKTTNECVEMFSEILTSIKFNPESIVRSLDLGYLTATDLADYLTKKDIPFREAHRITGKIVSYCEKRNLKLTEVSLQDFKKFSKLIEQDIYKFISINSSVESKKSYGGTSKSNVRKMISQSKKLLSKI
ncbi:MAG: argininosuccinate lyase [Thermodesulfobacteriota bacterium]|nr:argininosuccinate lyase [Thermodesulfobacteriota bacterium]